MADFVNSKVGVDGWFVLGRMQVVRANVALNYDMEEVSGWVVCHTEVHPWPFSEDDEGFPFDQDNLYAVRTRTWRQPLADGGGDDFSTVVAVPKTLPAEYTAVLRYSILTDGFYYDYIGEDPMSGWSWNHRTPTGLLWDLGDTEQAERARWTPMNCGQQVYGPTSFDQSLLEYIPMPPDFNFYESYRVVGLASDHIGFRAGRVTVTLVNAYADYPISVSVALKIASRSVLADVWDSGAPPGDTVDYQTVTVSATFTTIDDADYVDEIDLDEMLPDPGIRHNFFVYLDPLGAVEEFQPYFVAEFYLAPRTDVPLHYSASMANRVAPGGYIAPA